jgi:dCTP deaminase
MILCDKTIKDYIATGKIKILPEFNMADVRPAGIRLHLGHELLIPVAGQTVDLASADDIKFERVHINEKGFTLRPDQFILASTFERFQVPRNIVCHVDGRSTVARIGLSIHCTSAMVEGNFEEARGIVLEIKNQGPFDIILRHKTALALLSFNQLSDDIEQKTQMQYKDQEGVVAPNLKLQKK